MPDKIEITDEQRMKLMNFALFAKQAKMILKDMNQTNLQGEFFKKYNREDVIKWIDTPQKFEKKLIEISKYCYMVSPHYRRVCDYFSKMSLLSYVAVPYKLDMKKFDKKNFLECYKNTIDILGVMNIKNEWEKIITELFVADVAYVCEYKTDDSYFCRLLPYDRCQISSNIDGVLQFQFDFQYFDKYPKQLSNYGEGFISKYNIYKKNRTKYRWQELNDENSFAVKLSDNVNYSIPIFANLITTIFDLEDLRKIEKAKDKLNIYKLLLMKLPLDENGNFAGGDFDKALEYYDFLSECVDDNVGIGMSPYEIQDFSFEQSGTASQVNAYSESVSSFFTASGVSELLFNSSKSSSATISSSIKNDSEMVCHIHRMIERVINKKLKQFPDKYKFEIKMLDVTTYNQKEYIDSLLKACTYGAPIKNELLACFGYTPAQSYGTSILEDCLDIVNSWKPLHSSNTQSGSNTTDEGGRPKIDDTELSDAGVQTRENDNRKDDV